MYINVLLYNHCNNNVRAILTYTKLLLLLYFFNVYENVSLKIFKNAFKCLSI